MPHISVLIPVKPDGGKRDAAFRWIRKRYERLMPGTELCIERSRAEPFCKSRLVNDAAQKSTGGILVIADADIVFDPVIITRAVQHLDHHPWVIPFKTHLALSRGSTQYLIKQDSAGPIPDRKLRAEKVRRNSPGKLYVVPRAHFKAVGGFDERFVGWGGEDAAFVRCVDTLCGPHIRLGEQIYHLWHPPAPTKRHYRGSFNSRLHHRYREASGNTEAMRTLIAERHRSRDD